MKCSSVPDLMRSRRCRSSTSSTEDLTAKNNEQSIDQTIKALNDSTRGLIFSNLVDFDMLYGHRRDTEVLVEVNGVAAPTDAAGPTDATEVVDTPTAADVSAVEAVPTVR